MTIKIIIMLIRIMLDILHRLINLVWLFRYFDKTSNNYSLFPLLLGILLLGTLKLFINRILLLLKYNLLLIKCILLLQSYSLLNANLVLNLDGW